MTKPAAPTPIEAVIGEDRPHINLFASKAAAERYLARPELRGTILTVPDATDAGRRLFGDLLERLCEASERS
jgi:hypothetical protein